MPTKQELYWADREQKFLMENLLDQKDMDNLIKETNIKALNDCQDALYAWYGKYGDATGITVAEARKAAETADVQALAKKAKEYVKNKDFSPQANADMKMYNFAMRTSREELLANQLKWRMFEMTDQQERIMERVLPEQAMKVLRRQSGILGKTLYSEEEMKKLADYITHTSYKGNTFSTNLWGYEQDMKKELDRLIRQSMTMGRNPAQSATQFAKLFGRQQHEAERLIRTEAARVRAHARRDSFIKAGYQYFKWIPRGNPCERCLEKVKASEAEPFPIKGGDMPPLHPYCYCSTAPVERDEDILSKEQIDADFERNWAKAKDGDLEQRAYFEKLYQGQSKVAWGKVESGGFPDFMGQPKNFGLGRGLGDIKAYQYKDNPRYWLQNNNAETQNLVKYLDENLELYEKEFGKLDNVIIASERSFSSGVAAYQQSSNQMFLRDSLGDDKAVEEFLKDGRFPAKNRDDILIHEFAHKKHWDAIKEFYNVHPSRYNSIEDAKNEFDAPIRKFVTNQLSSDPLYLKKTISLNSYEAFEEENLNEFVADSIILLKTGTAHKGLEELLKEAFGL